jgi:anaerobic selenocysteine-containing dehydrogenase
MEEVKVSNRICPVCEAGCGLEIVTRGREITGIRGDAEDFFSRGHICPKGVALKDLDTDPDRLRQPLLRRNGKLEPASWQEAFEAINTALPAIREAHGAQSVAVYIGNPTAHNLGLAAGFGAFAEALGTRNIFTAGTIDQIPKQFACGLMFGDTLTVPVPDIDRCDYLLMLGANPIVSNGSLWMVPDFRGRLREMQARGGRLVVIDPRRTETAAVADAHHFIRPGTDAQFLFALLHVLFRDGLADPGAIAAHIAGYEEIGALARKVSLDDMSAQCGISVETVEEIARALVANERAAVYGRVGTTTQKHGSLASWLIDVINVVAGNLDRPGGAMFALPPAFAANTRGEPGRGAGFTPYRYRSRVSGYPEVNGELPVAALAEEIEGDGDERVRAFVCIAGNPVLSAPNAARFDRALGTLDFMVAVDIYLSETARHADVVLPGTPALEKCHYDNFLSSFLTRNAARFSPALFEPAPGDFSEWEIMLQLAAISSGAGVLTQAGLHAMEDMIVRQLISAATGDPFGVACGQDEEEVFAKLGNRRGVERVLDLQLRVGPYGDGFGKIPGGLTLAAIEAAPHSGIDLGPLEPRIPEVLRTPSGKIELAPDLLMRAADALLAAAPARQDGMILIGRRQTRSNNSWMHNLPVLAKGPFRCTLMVHPSDAERLALEDGGRALVRARAGEIEAVVETSDTLMPGVVSLPHGWGHSLAGTELALAAARPGVNSNILTDDAELETLTGTAILNGIPVEVERLPAA